MSAQRTNSAIVFVAVLVAAVIVIYAVVNRPGTKPAGPNPNGDAPPPLNTPQDEQHQDTGVTHIDQTTDTTTPPTAEDEPASGESAEPAVTPNLIDAAERGDLDAIASIAALGVDLNQTDTGGRTALMAAAGAGKTDAVFALLNAGADPALRDKSRRSARDYALARFDEPGQTIARILEDAVGPVPVTDPTDK